jgi:peptide/nickel transport system ATP-binding protein
MSATLRLAADELLRVENLGIATADGVPLVRDLGFRLARGGTIGVVGESGSGKSLTCRAILGVLPRGLRQTDGRIVFAGQDLSTIDARGWRALHGRRIGAVFQDPASYLNPSIRVGPQLAETLRATQRLSRRAARARALDLFAQVGLRDPEAVWLQYPWEISGGMAQRVQIAIAIAGDPDLLIADEATTALDVTVQAEILALLDRLRRERGLALVLVSHDLAVVSQMCEDLVVIRQGAVVEAGPTAAVLAAPRHDYTRLLVADHTRFGLERLDHAPPRRPPERAPEVLRMDGVVAAWPHARRPVLDGIDLSVQAGEILGVIGETGSGKTTLLRTILGLAPRTQGRISVAGQDITGLDGRRLRDFRRQGVVQHVFQDPLQSLDPALPVGRAIAQGLVLRGGLDKAAIAARVSQALDQVGLPAELATRYPQALSGGQRQRVVLARALVLDPRLLLLDEPVSALDAAARAHVLELLRALGRERGLAQVFVSHDLGSVAGLADRVAVLYQGRIVEQGPVDDVLRRPTHAYTAQLVASAPRLPPPTAPEARQSRTHG